MITDWPTATVVIVAITTVGGFLWTILKFHIEKKRTVTPVAIPPIQKTEEDFLRLLTPIKKDIADLEDKIKEHREEFKDLNKKLDKMLLKIMEWMGASQY